MTDSQEGSVHGISEEQAMAITEELLADGTVEMGEDTPVITHKPTGWEFESTMKLAYFHRGWELGRTDD
ncbi:hypothetical protein [Halobaculum rubrum]|uniref:hypothetical protein n=1 Tax=Halobaculum rubrum TaxID=2872158 RepID=UPI001CA45E25|nr:hypothetical protein [Halobaculum rubrum]QZY01199.1 hypothetical protein K6T25_15160 [Halobaculum rubrum]